MKEFEEACKLVIPVEAGSWFCGTVNRYSALTGSFFEATYANTG
jgi:hypothetical protein